MAKYSEAVEWIALNDAPGDTEGLDFDESVEQVKSNVTLCLIADVWNKDVLEVAKDVIKVRNKYLGN